MIRTTVRAAEIDWERRDPAPGWDASNLERRMVLRAPDDTTLRLYHHPAGHRHLNVVTWLPFQSCGPTAPLIAASRCHTIQPGVIPIPDHVENATVLTALSHVLVVDGTLAAASVVAFKYLDQHGLVKWPSLRVDQKRVPQRIMPPAVCRNFDCRLGLCGVTEGEQCPVRRCGCGYHAAFDPWLLCRAYHPIRGLLVVQAVGKTIWHQNAWRAERYAVHAAVVTTEDVPGLGRWPPLAWPDDIPVVCCDRADVPLVAWEIAQEVRAMQVLEREDEGCGRPADCRVDRQTDSGDA